MAELCSLLYLGAFAASGVCISRCFFYREKPLVRAWLGLAMGLCMLMWFPALFAFSLSFNLAAQLLGLLLALCLGVVCLLGARKRALTAAPWKSELAPLCVCFALYLFCCMLLSSHTIVTGDDGALYVGQSTYGDLAMHLGFISSIAVQGTFPPMYSICPDKPVCYPFLSSSVGSTFYLFGASLRFATLITAAFAMLLVILGAYLFFERWLKEKRKAIFAMLLVFVGGGFGFAYFFDLLKTNPGNLTRVFTAFYETPTNLVGYGMRWVNPIADMLVPQRALLFGWALLFPCLYLLHRAAIERDAGCFLPLALFAGSLPLIHTHSFLALGMISGFYLFRSLWRREGKAQYFGFLKYLIVVLILAMPQLILFTFRQSGSFLKLHFNWANEQDNYFWFYIKNLGLLALLAPVAFFGARKQNRGVCGGAILIWLVAEFIQFQPNPYDNNKLLFVAFFYLCGLIADWLVDTRDRLFLGGAHNRVSTRILSVIVCLALFLSGGLTLGREAVSEYQLIPAGEVQAAAYIKENAAPDATFLTHNNHNNFVAALTGRNIVCGSGTFLYFHGVDYSAREYALKKLYEEPSLYFHSLGAEYGIDYVVVGSNEAYNYTVDYDYFDDNCDVFYENDAVIIYKVR